MTNYCPLVFMKSSGSNFTPDKLPPVERDRLKKLCDEHLRRVLEILEPAWLIGVGAWARKRGELVAAGTRVQIGQILHPSPASPKANRGWAAIATQEMIQLGIWK